MDLEDPELPGQPTKTYEKLMKNNKIIRKMDLEDPELPGVDFLIVFNKKP